MTSTRPHLELVSPPDGWVAVQAGEPEALEGLFAEWLPVILQWCRRLGGPRVDPDQAAQDVAMVVLAKVHTVASPRALPSWIYAVTRRVLAQHRRRRWGMRWAAGAEVDRSASPSDPERDLSRVQLIDAVRAAVDDLPLALREVLVLCDLEGREQAAVAELLGLPVGTVKSRLRRARHTFGRIAQARGLATAQGLDEEGP